MAEGEQNFSLPDSDQIEFDQQNITGDMHNEYNIIPEHEVDDQTLIAHDEHGATENEPENNFEQNDTDNENENEQTLDGGEHDQVLDGIELKHELPEGEANEHEEDANADQKEEHENNSVPKVEEKKWPGWPGDSVFRMLVPGQKVGNIMGRKGEYIKKMVEETRARIKVMDGPPGSQERAVYWHFLGLQIHPCCYYKQGVLKMPMPRSAWA